MWPNQLFEIFLKRKNAKHSDDRRILFLVSKRRLHQHRGFTTGWKPPLSLGNRKVRLELPNMLKTFPVLEQYLVEDETKINLDQSETPDPKHTTSSPPDQ